MVLRNVHSHPKIRNLCDLFVLAMSYVPCGIALLIIFSIIYPYWFFFIQETMYYRAFGNALRDSLGAPPLGTKGSAAVPAGQTGSTNLEVFLYFYSMIGGIFWWGMLLWSYAGAIFTCPGYVDPDVWRHPPFLASDKDIDLTNAPNPNIVTEVTRAGEMRYCNKCQLYKPDNSHHCSECEHCVLAMDHHCPWINNCVGERNMKMFTLFISYIPLAAIHMCGTIAVGLNTHYSFDFAAKYNHALVRNVDHTFHSVFIMIGGMAAAIVGVVLGGFAGYNWYLMSEGSSTLEAKFGKKKVGPNGVVATSQEEEDLALLNDERKKKSCWTTREKNLRSVMGQKLWMWAIPRHFDQPWLKGGRNGNNRESASKPENFV